MGKKYNLLNQKFGRLFVREKSYITDKKERKRIVWLCDCDCEKHIAIPTSSLTHGLTKYFGEFAPQKNLFVKYGIEV